MTIAHLLEDFDVAEAHPDLSDPDQDEAQEELRLAVFEQGYSAGWEDAIAAHADDHARATGALARSLQDISFSYHEALGQMAVSIEPLLRALIDTVLPAALSATLGEHLVEQIARMAGDRAAQPVEVVVPAGAGAAVRSVLDRDLAMPVRVVEDPTLDPGRAYIRLGRAEREVDCDHLLAALAEATDACIHQFRKETAHE
jgi:flagellar assembly protein FliH